MKRIFFTSFALIGILLFCNLYTPNDNGVAVLSKDTKIPDWQWTSGNLNFKNTQVKPCFSIVFIPSIYQPGDSVEIIFKSYKVTLTNLTKGTTFDGWKGKVILVHYLDKKWPSLVNDTIRRMEFPFSGKKNHTSDSLTNYTLKLAVPASRAFTIAGSLRGIAMNNADGDDQPAFAEGGQMLSLSIKGIEIKKIN